MQEKKRRYKNLLYQPLSVTLVDDCLSVAARGCFEAREDQLTHSVRADIVAKKIRDMGIVGEKKKERVVKPPQQVVVASRPEPVAVPSEQTVTMVEVDEKDNAEKSEQTSDESLTEAGNMADLNSSKKETGKKKTKSHGKGRGKLARS